MPHKRYDIEDNAYYTLTNAINASQATINVTSPTTYTWRKSPPNTNYIGTLVKYGVDGNPSKIEKVYVTATAGAVLTVQRGYLGDAQQSFDAGDYLFVNVVAEHIDDIHLRIDEVETDKQAQLTDIYNEGTRRLRVYRLTTDPALQVRIGAGDYFVGGVAGLYAGGTLTVTNNTTTYVMVDNGGNIQTGATWNSIYARLAIVTSSGGVITSIVNYKSDAVGGDFGGNPTGSVMAWTTTSAPSGYLICDGSAISRTTYSALFSVIGTTFGVGNGSTTFNIPNVKGRALVGLDSAQSEFDLMGETGGSKTHTLTVQEMPAHSHGFAQQSSSASANGTLVSHGNTTENNGQPITTDTGGGQAHNNLQPYITMNFIIKT